VASWSWAEAQATVLRAWLDEHGLVDDEAQPRPAVRMLEGVEGRLAGLRAQLGLTPLALGKLLATSPRSTATRAPKASRRSGKSGRSCGPRPTADP
jgi:hypothetical protein